MTLKNSSSFPTTGTEWHELYVAALFETDEKKLPLRITQAERALVRRARDLFAMPCENIDEEQTIDDALYALGALRNCLKLKTRQPAA